MCGPQAPPNSSKEMASENCNEQQPVGKQDAHELFTSDEFRVFCFKVLPCSKRFVHDWPSCPFAHPGEKAKRRDPRTHQYDCEMCPAVLKGEVCELGAACPHSHHVFESWLHPQKYRTLLCKDGDQCHREVCFFAHGSKQLRTPERSHQQRISQQQRYSPMAESAHKLQAASRSSSANSSYHNGRQGGYQQQGVCANGVTMVNGSPSSSASTTISLAQLQGQGMSACATPYAAADAALLQQQQQALLGSQVDGSMHVQLQALMGANGHTGGDVSQLLHSLAAEANASKHEAAEHSRAAALAQQKLQLLEQLLGCNGTALAPAAGAGQGFGTPMTSPVATQGWQVAPGAGQQLLLSGPQLTQLLHMQQQMAAHAALEGPRRHSLDESLLRRVRNLQQNLPASSSSRGTSLWNASPSAGLSNLTPVTEGAVLGMPSRSAATDIEALAAAFSAAGLPVDGQAALLNSMQGAGMPSGGSVLSPAASAAMAAAQLGGAGHSSWMVQQGADATWGQGMGLSSGMAQFGAFHSGSQLPAIPFSGAALLNGNGSISAPQLQSDYLLQLHAALQASGVTALPEPQRASFDVAATYLPPLPGDLLAGRNAAADMLAAGADDVAGASNSSVIRSSGCSNVQEPPAVPAVSDKLASNPIGGAGQLGWF